MATFSVDLYMFVMFDLYNESINFDYQFWELDFDQLASYCLDTGGLGHIVVVLSLFHIKSMNRPICRVWLLDQLLGNSDLERAQSNTIDLKTEINLLTSNKVNNLRYRVYNRR